MIDDFWDNNHTRKMLKRKYGNRLIKYKGSYYVKDEQPTKGQSEPFSLPDGTPIMFVAWFMDDC